MNPGMALRSKLTVTTPKVLIHRREPSCFKVCPVCNTLNVVENQECCNCAWRGEFVTESHVVQTRMWHMVSSNAELQMLLLKELRKRPWWRRAWDNFRSMFRRRIDFVA